MSLITGLVLTMAIVFWIVSPSFEWNIPPKWEAALIKWKLQRSGESEGYVVKESSPEDEEMEKRCWFLRKELLNFGQYSKRTIRIEIPIDENLSNATKERYIACLERRFPDMWISVTAASLKDGQKDRV